VGSAGQDTARRGWARGAGGSWRPRTRTWTGPAAWVLLAQDAAVAAVLDGLGPDTLAGRGFAAADRALLAELGTSELLADPQQERDPHDSTRRPAPFPDELVQRFRPPRGRTTLHRAVCAEPFEARPSRAARRKLCGSRTALPDPRPRREVLPRVRPPRRSQRDRRDPDADPGAARQRRLRTLPRQRPARVRGPPAGPRRAAPRARSGGVRRSLR
jgi:hypothetical protein